MKRGFFILCLALFPVLFSCNSNSKVEKSFGPARELRAEQIPISELLKINNIAIMDDYVVLQNSSEGVEDFFFVYTRSDVRFLYSFGKRGRGPSEYLMPSIIKNTPDNILGFRDHGTDNVVFYDISDTAAVLRGAKVFSSPDSDRFFWEINLIGDSLLLTKHQGYKRGLTELWNIRTQEIVDSIPNTFSRLPRKLGKAYYTIFDDYMIASCGHRLVRSYYLIDRIEFGEVSGDELRLISGTGATTVPEFHLYGHDSATEYSIDRNIVYYENIYAGEENVYALYSGRRLDETDHAHSSLIEVYSWDGSPVELLHLDIPVAYFAVDEENRIIYGVNPEFSEEKILKYRY